MILKYKDLTVDTESKMCTINNTILELSKREYDLLVFLMSNPNYIYSREAIVKTLWNNSVSLRVVDTTISRLRKKLDIYNKNIVTRPGFGYYFNSDESRL